MSAKPQAEDKSQMTSLARTVAILSYHKIGPPAPGGWESWYYVSEETFRHQLELSLGVGIVILPEINFPQLDTDFRPEMGVRIFLQT